MHWWKRQKVNKIESLFGKANKRESLVGRRIQASGNESRRQEEDGECGWEKGGNEGGTWRQSEAKRECSILEP